MIQKRKPPYWVLPVLLVGLLLISYFVSGLWVPDRLSIHNQK